MRKRYKCHIYEDEAGEFRWRLKARNGRIVADSGEGYRDENGATRAWNNLHYNLYALQHVDVVYDR